MARQASRCYSGLEASEEKEKDESVSVQRKLESLGFRLRLYPWDESRKIMVVGFDVPDGSSPEKPQQPPVNWMFAVNNPKSVAAAVERQAHETLLWWRSNFLFASQLKLAFSKWMRARRYDDNWSRFWWKLECRYRLYVDNLKRLNNPPPRQPSPPPS